MMSNAENAMNANTYAQSKMQVTRRSFLSLLSDYHGKFGKPEAV